MEVINVDQQTKEEREARESVANGGFPPVFPAPYYTQGTSSAFPSERFEEPGMTIRESFAMEAMGGLARNPEWGFRDEDVVAEKAVKMADALIQALNK